ncbi:MAG: DUF58 domain-containing protein [Opitutales bacterium]|jgi:uncharacterized protein (DUF58 family)
MPVDQDLLNPAWLAEIEDYSLLSRLVVEGLLPGLHRSLRHGRGSEFFQYRAYVPGEDLKLIDWKVYAKRGELLAKTYQEDTNLNVYLVVDCSGSMGYQGDRAACDKLHYASMAAACIAYLANRQGDRVGLFSYGDEIQEWIPPRNGSGHLDRFFQGLARLNASGTSNHRNSWETLTRALPGRGLVIFLSDCLEVEDELPELLRFAHSPRYDCLCLQILDPDELDLPHDEALLFEDMEDGRQTPTHPDATRDRYIGDMNDYCKQLADNLGVVGVEFDSLTTHSDLGLALRRVLHHRSLGS